MDRTYTIVKSFASKYRLGRRARDASGLNIRTFANCNRVAASSSVKPDPWMTLIRAAPPGFKTSPAVSLGPRGPIQGPGRVDRVDSAQVRGHIGPPYAKAARGQQCP